MLLSMSTGLRLGLFVFALLGMLVIFVSCAPVTFLNTITPSGSYKLAKNLPYGTGARQKLDIYAPDTPRKDKAVLVFVHGGSWSDGNKNMYKFVGEAFATEGFMTVIPNYLMYPQVRYPEFINDTAAAIAFAAKKYPGVPLYVLGHSAGAYNAMMVTVDPKYLKAHGMDICQTINATIGLAGPYGAFPLEKEPYITIFPDLHTGDDAPAQIKLGPTPPVFLPIGDKDTTVSDLHGRALAKNIIARGGQAEFKLYAGLNHTEMVKVLSRYFDGGSTLKTDILTFIEAQPKPSDNFCK